MNIRLNSSGTIAMLNYDDN